ncbi:uncharacterized protein LOC122665160 [Telopea speciosissima]|uniref:uncharacterized protein LOC122665160 n=1 Tax=Telopea speciosissima TaxID=54955 RepID=UPI001CC33A84|nr:uncharacterized protein LOC122665160 [Telopea speciosissima]
MGLDTELEFQKYRRVGKSPRNVHHSRCYSSKDDDRDVKGKPTSSGYQLKIIDQDYTEISFDDSQNSVCKRMPSGPAGLAGNEELKRGSIYQSSKEVRKMKKMGEFERRKIELLRSSDTSLSFQIVDSLSQSNDSSTYEQQKRSSSMSAMTDLGKTLDDKTYMAPNSPDSLDLYFGLFPSPGNVVSKDAPSDNFFEICLDTEDRKHQSAETIDKGTVGKLNFRCDRSVGHLNSSHCLLERDMVLALHKSSSEKVGMSHSPFSSDGHHSKGSPKVRFNPIRRMFDPILKSKSQRSQPVSVAEFGDITTLGLASIRRKKTVCKSLLHDFSNSVQKEEPGAHFVKNDKHRLDVASSPAHLHGLLKLDYKHGVPFLEFSLNNLEDTLVAKTWKGHNAFNWVYTFHSLNNRRKSGTSGWSSKERHKEASMVGQMQVSCYLCSTMQNAGAFDNSMVTEFVLYDIAHARKNFATQGSPDCQADSIKPPKGPYSGDSDKGFSMDLNDVLDPAKLKHQTRHASGNDYSDVSTPYPWAPADLLPYLEIAAVVIQVPFQKRESLKDEQGDCGKACSNLVDFSVVEQRRDDTTHNISPAKVKVVTSTGTHGLPSTEGGRGPSPLLDRWRSGGGCNCGGWDMACPLVVFGNPIIQNVGDHHVGSRQPLELFVQGGKEKMPALTINLIDEGQYSVDFHAQLSTLQAFSICVAILHSTADCTAAEQERTTHRLQCNSLKLLLEEEVRFLIEAVAEEEKRKATKIMEETPPSFVINPPFSPIARV